MAFDKVPSACRYLLFASPHSLAPSPTSAVFSRFSAVGSDKFFVFNVGVIIIENSDEYVASKKSISPLFLS
jgi:hypothetical protein